MHVHWYDTKYEGNAFARNVLSPLCRRKDMLESSRFDNTGTQPIAIDTYERTETLPCEFRMVLTCYCEPLLSRYA